MAEQKEKAIAKTESGSVAAAPQNTIVPPVDIYEDGDAVTLFADLPGVSKDNLEVQIDKDTLKITGKRVPLMKQALVFMLRFQTGIIIGHSPLEKK